MFNPMVVAGGFAAAAGKPIIDMAGTTLASWIDAVTLPLKYEINYKQRTQLPSVADGFEAYLTGNMSRPGFDELCAFHNIPNMNDKKDIFQKVGAAAWSNVFNSKIPRLPMESIIYLYLSGVIKKPEADDFLKKYAFNKDQLNALWSMLEPRFEPTVTLNNFYRGWWSDETVVPLLRRQFGCSKTDAEILLKSSQFTPPPSDIIRFAVKSVYNKDEIKEFELDAEYDEIGEAKAWANAVGITDKTKVKYGGKEYERDILRDYWIAHWDLMSPTQGYQALHRLRPHRLSRYNKGLPNLKPFEHKQLGILLKMKDYVKPQRDWLQAISYNNLGRIDLRRLFNDNTIDAKELSEQYYDLGYNEADTKLLVDWQIDEKKRKDDDKEKKKLAKNYGRLIAETLAGYEEGSINRDSAFNTLSMMYDDADRAFNEMSAIDIRVNRKRIKQYILMVKNEFFHGLYDGLAAYTELVVGGVADIRANQYVIRWQRELDRPRRIVGITTVLDWMKRALITVENAKKRLETLGLSNADTLLYLQQANQDIQTSLAIESAKKAKSDKQRISESERLLDRLKQQGREAQAVLRSYSPLSAMKRWLQLGEITPNEVHERMTFLGIPNADQQRYFDEWGIDATVS